MQDQSSGTTAQPFVDNVIYCHCNPNQIRAQIYSRILPHKDDYI